MQYKSVKGFTGWGQLGILLVFTGFGLILAGVVQFIIGMKMIPAATPFQEMGEAMLKAMRQQEHVGYTRLIQVMGSLFLLFVPAILYSWITNGRNKFWLGFNPYINVQQVILGFGLIFFANILAGPVADLSKMIIAHFPSLDIQAKHLEDIYNEQVVAISNLKNWPEFLMALLIMAFFPALFEEVFFRGAMQNLFIRWWKKPLLAIIVTSVVFSLVHSSIYLFASRIILGFVLGLMYYNTKNIWVNVIAHFLNNAIAVTQMFYLSNQKEKIDVTKLDPKVAWWFGVIALLVAYFLFRLLTRYSIKNREKINTQEQLILAKENVYDPFAKNENS